MKSVQRSQWVGTSTKLLVERVIVWVSIEWWSELLMDSDNEWWNAELSVPRMSSFTFGKILDCLQFAIAHEMAHILKMLIHLATAILQTHPHTNPHVCRNYAVIRQYMYTYLQGGFCPKRGRLSQGVLFTGATIVREAECPTTVCRSSRCCGSQSSGIRAPAQQPVSWDGLAGLKQGMLARCWRRDLVDNSCAILGCDKLGNNHHFK